MQLITKAARTALLSASLGVAVSGGALAQSMPPPPPVPTATQSGLQDVVITARHRAERAQTVPIALTVVDHRQLQNLGSLNLSKIKQLVPSLTLNAYNPRNIGLDIRGLGSVGFLGYDGLEGGVGVYEDGVLLGRSQLTNFDIPDLQDIEVLRGPQGTLFGKNTVAGAVVINTKVPSFKPEADFSASYGNYHYWQFLGYATSALGNSDNAAVSLGVHATQHVGFTKNSVTGQNYNNEDDKGLDTQFLLEPTSSLTVRIIANYDHSDANCCIQIPSGEVTSYANGAPVAVNALQRYNQVGYKLPTINIFDERTDIDSWTHYAMETGSLAVHADYDLHGFTLSSITAGGYYNWYPRIDGDDVGIPIITTALAVTHQRQFSQELRVTSPSGGAIDFTSGLYFFYQQLNDQARSTYGSDAAGVYLAGGPLNPSYRIYQAALNGFIASPTDLANTFSGAAYGQATWHILPQFDLTGGARFTYEDKTADYYQNYQEGGVTLADSGLTAAQQAAAQTIRNGFAPNFYEKFQHSNILPGGLATLSYKPAPGILTYATYSHGEKSAGLNFVTADVPKVVAPEKLDDYELGAKTTLLNGHLLLDGDAFWDEDTDFQSSIYGPSLVPGGQYVVYLANVPKVRSRGLEADIHALISENLTLFTSATFNEAYYESDPSGVCPYEDSNAAKTCDLTGRPLAGASRWAGAFGGEYDQPLPPVYGRNTLAYFGGNFLLKSGFYSTGDDSKYGWVPGYGLGNIAFGIRQADGKWDLSGWVRNVTNAHYYLFRSATSSFPTYNIVTGEIGDPLTFGVTLAGKFD
jgi:iron complex outermembrane receptor protein